jgi:hypothetical protein
MVSPIPWTNHWPTNGARTGGAATVLKGCGETSLRVAATLLEGRGAVTVLEGCAGVEAVGLGGGESTEEEVLVDPTGTGWPVVAPCRIITPMTIAATAAEAASGMSPVIHRRGGAFCDEVSNLGTRSAWGWLSRQSCPAW